MRLLMFILTLAWLVFGWFCYNAIHWKKPMEVPWHVADQLQIYTPELIEAKIANSLITLSRGTNLPAIEKAHYHFELAQGFWLKAFIQKSRVHQITFLNRSLYEIQAALRLYPQESDY